MNSEGQKIVNYAEYCTKCKHFDLEVSQEPCNECLSRPVNLYSHKPINWEEADDTNA